MLDSEGEIVLRNLRCLHFFLLVTLRLPICLLGFSFGFCPNVAWHYVAFIAFTRACVLLPRPSEISNILPVDSLCARRRLLEHSYAHVRVFGSLLACNNNRRNLCASFRSSVKETTSAVSCTWYITHISLDVGVGAVAGLDVGVFRSPTRKWKTEKRIRSAVQRRQRPAAGENAQIKIFVDDCLNPEFWVRRLMPEVLWNVLSHTVDAANNAFPSKCWNFC